jgi:hypothetical protein
MGLFIHTAVAARGNVARVANALVRSSVYYHPGGACIGARFLAGGVDVFLRALVKACCNRHRML